MTFENPTIEKEEGIEGIIDEVADKDPRVLGREFDPDATNEYKVTPDQLQMIHEAREAQPDKTIEEVIKELQDQGLLDKPEGENGLDKAA